MIRTMLAAPVLAPVVAICLAGAPLAQEAGEELASAEEVAQVNAAIAAFNCGPHDEVEKETESLFELDDVACKAGQYDIKLDGTFTVISMTYDGPIDDD